MKESQTRSILAIVIVDENSIKEANVPTFIAKDEKEQEKLASEIARVLGGNIYGLANGIIIITQE